MKIKRRTSLCREGLYYVVVLGFVVVGAFLREINLLLVLAGMMLGPLVMNWRIAVASLRGVGVRRRLPSAISAGDLFVVDLVISKARSRLRGLWPDARMVTVEDQITLEGAHRGGGRTRVRVSFRKVRRGKSERLSYRGRLHRRGKYRFGPLRIATRFPLGFVRRTLIFSNYESLTVFPQRGKLTPAWERLYRKADQGGRSRRQHGLVEGDFHSLRDWLPGDAVRWIHWRTTARRGHPVVRQFEEQQNRDLCLLVDLSTRQMGSEDERIESAIRFAATVVEDVCRLGGSRLLLGTAGKELTILKGTTSNSLMLQMLEHLATVQPTNADRLEELLCRGIDQTRRGAGIIVVTPQPVDLTDAERFPAIADDPYRETAAAHALSIDVASGGLSTLFLEPSGPAEAATQKSTAQRAMST